MAKIKFDVSGSDPDKASGGNFEQPKPGVYKAKVKEINDTNAKNSKTGKPDPKRPMLEVVYEITDKKYNGSRIWDYIVLTEAAMWKYDQFLQAFGLATKKKRKGSFDTDDLIGESCKVRIKGETYQGEYRAKVGAVLAIGEDEEDDDVEEDDDELDLDDDDIEEGDDDEDELEDEDDDELEEEDEDEADSEYYTEAALTKMSLADLKTVAADEFDLEDLPRGKSKIVAAILEAQAAPEEEEEGDEPEDDYDDWEVADLKSELKDRELKATGNKQALIDRLREDDSEEPF